jgi:hypothetical protein
MDKCPHADVVNIGILDDLTVCVLHRDGKLTKCVRRMESLYCYGWCTNQESEPKNAEQGILALFVFFHKESGHKALNQKEMANPIAK